MWENMLPSVHICAVHATHMVQLAKPSQPSPPSLKSNLDMEKQAMYKFKSTEVMHENRDLSNVQLNED